MHEWGLKVGWKGSEYHLGLRNYNEDPLSEIHKVGADTSHDLRLLKGLIMGQFLRVGPNHRKAMARKPFGMTDHRWRPREGILWSHIQEVHWISLQLMKFCGFQMTKGWGRSTMVDPKESSVIY